jgi:hypothetical protein
MSIKALKRLSAKLNKIAHDSAICRANSDKPTPQPSPIKPPAPNHAPNSPPKRLG